MCGICGIISLKNQLPKETRLTPMMEAMKHRGPDDAGVFTENVASLGFVRLSIIDLSSAGHQPMLSDDGRFVLVFNGEIYNYLELREELSLEGVEFKTNTDSEVLLKSYIAWDSDCLNRFNGMWAFVIYDRLEQKIFAARDRYGVKPFYYYVDDTEFIFASEIPPLLTALNEKPQANHQVIFDFLTFNRTDQTEETFFEGIKKLQHGSILTINDGKPEIKKWYSLKDNLKTPFQNPQEFYELFSSSINLRLRSDVPVGVCLSGGLDSSAIVSTLAHEFKKNDTHTFSAIYESGQSGDESKFIYEYSGLLKNMHYIKPSAKSLYDEMNSFIKAHAEPIPSTSPYAQYKVMQLAQKNVVVTLDGQGADELLAGYHYFFGYFFKELLLKGKFSSLVKELFSYLKIHKSLYGLKSFGFFMLPELMRTQTRVNALGYINPEFVKKYKNSNSISGNLYNSRSLQDALIDHFEYKLEHLLKWEDRNSMFFSLEARTPFLDYRLVEKSLSLPSEKVIKDGTTKYILREAMKGIIPEPIRNRNDKIGFGTPQAEWFREPEFQVFIKTLLSSSSFKSREIILPEKALKIYKLHLNKKGDYSKEIWKWINLELWYREFID